MTDWAQAACADHDATHWDDEDEFAFHHCQVCPIMAACLQQSMLPKSEGGSWNQGMLGGWTLAQRQYFKRRGLIPKPIVWVKPPKVPAIVGRPLGTASEAQRRDLHRQGMTDHEIAVEVGVTEAAIESWRRSRHLQPNNTRRGPLTADDENNRMQAWELGFTDSQAARMLRCSLHSYRMWRRRNHLRTNPLRLGTAS